MQRGGGGSSGSGGNSRHSTAAFFKATPYKTERPSTGWAKEGRLGSRRGLKGTGNPMASAPAGLEGGMDWTFPGHDSPGDFSMIGTPGETMTGGGGLGGRGKPGNVPSLNLSRPGRRATTAAADSSMSVRGTRKENLEYLTSLLGSRSHRSGSGAFTLRGEETEADPEGSHEQNGSTHRSPPREPVVASKESKKSGGKQLSFVKYRSLYDVATFSEFSSSQDFAGGGVAALCCIASDRDSVFHSGGIKYMLDLLVNGKSVRAKCDALDAIGSLIKSRDACRELLGWKGRDTKTGGEYSGLGVIFRMKSSKYAQAQKAAISVVSAVLTSDALKHAERLLPDYMEGLCGFGYASDEQTGIIAGKTLVNVMSMVLDQGIRWTEATLLPLVKLARASEIYPKNRTLALKALALAAKEGDSVCRILSTVGVVKAISVQLAARADARIGPDDVNSVRIVTQICEADGSRYEDVVVIGAVPRIIQILKKHLVEQSFLLPHEQEMQRRCGRFLEKVSGKPHLRPQIFQAGTAALFLNILMMEHASSYTKETYALALVSLCQDPVVSASWLKNEPGETSKFGRLIAGNDEELCLISLSLIALLAVCPDNALQLISARNLTAQVIYLMEESGKLANKQTKFRYLKHGIEYLYNLAHIPEGISHVKAWHVVQKIDPIMRGMRGSLGDHGDNDILWRHWDSLSTIMHV